MNEARFREAEQRLWTSFGVTPTEQRIRLSRVGVTVRVQEVGEGPAVVFVHGATNGGSSWAPLVARLEGFRCVLLDRPGCGLSDPLVKGLADMQRLAEFGDSLIIDVLDAMGLDKAHVVATSFGGYMGLRAAAAHPARIDRMVEFGWTIGAPIGKTPFVMRLAGIPIMARLMASVPPNKRAVRAMLRSIGLRQAIDAGRVSDEAIEWFLALLRDTDTMRNEIKTMPRVISAIRGMNDSLLLPESLLASIRTPIYFLWGEEDLYGGPETARQFVARIPGAELELLPAAGHAPWMDNAEHAATTTSRFLRQVSPAPPK